MITRNIQHLLMVSLKYFFDIDHYLCYHTFNAALLVLAFVKMFFIRAMLLFYDGLQTVKNDMHIIKTEIIVNKQRWSSLH